MRYVSRTLHNVSRRRADRLCADLINTGVTLIVRKMDYKLLILVFVYFNEALCARILGVFPALAKSHWIAVSPLIRELARRGHQVTSISTFPLDAPVDNYTDIRIRLSMKDLFQQGNDSQNFFAAAPKFWHAPLLMSVFGTKTSEKILSDTNVQKLLRDKNSHFDLIIYESFFTDSILGLAHKYKAPAILFCPFVGEEFIGDAVGNPNPYAYVPNVFLSYSDRMSFFERLINTAASLLVKISFHLIAMQQQNALLKQYFAGSEEDDLPHVSQLYQNMSLVLVNSHESVSYPKPLVPNLVHVGGLHITPPQKLPKDLQAFLDSAKDGVVYFSMGSHILSSDLPDEKRNIFLKVFSNLKQKVLWKFEDDALPGQPPNLKIQKWIPQNDVLAHPNLRVFITHGGLLSTQEATHHGVPVVGIPIMGDQKLNMARTEHLGCGLTLSFANVSVTSLTWALNEVLNNPVYRENAQYRSRIFRDRLNTPLETAVYWTEYVLRHRGAPHLRSAALDLAWYQYYLLDVITVILLAFTATALVFLAVVKTTLNLCRRKSAKEIRLKND